MLRRYRKRWRQEVILGDRRSYSATGGHTRRQRAILVGRRPYSAAVGHTGRLYPEDLFLDSYSCTIVTLPFCAKIVRIAVYVIWYRV
jgi:hypothetical protein